VLASFRSPACNASGALCGAGSAWVASNLPPYASFRHAPQSGECVAALYLARPEAGGLRGIQWRPYAPSETPPHWLGNASTNQVWVVESADLGGWSRLGATQSTPSSFSAP
jgi:hypothetical protein